VIKLCLTKYLFLVSHTHNGDDTLPRATLHNVTLYTVAETVGSVNTPLFILITPVIRC
jgi:hypothetical protein